MVARTNGPYYNLSDFITACSSLGAVIIKTDARSDAERFFNLKPDSRIFGYIANGGLHNHKHDNTRPLEKGPPQDIGKPVDGYTFEDGPSKPGYIAFYFNFKNIWVIKSLHPPEVGEKAPPLTHTPFSALEVLKK